MKTFVSTFICLILLASSQSTVIGSSFSDNTLVSTTTKELSEASALRAQLDVMRQYDQRLMATVYWSLGVLATVTIFLIGFGWFANFRLYERDKLALKQELQLLIQDEFLKIKAELIAEGAKQYEKILTDSRSAIASATAAVRNELLSNIQSIDRNVIRIQCEMAEARGDMWERKKILSNALRSYSEMLNLALELHDQYVITDSLDKIHRVLKKIADDPAESRPDALETSELFECLGKVPREHTIAVNSIRKLLEITRSK